jgi:heme-degrading monooxygenase HmoA
MIARTWRGSTGRADADRYVTHLRQNVVPELSSIHGYCGIQVLRRSHADAIDFIVITLWESMDAIRGFTGPDTDMAVVAPEAQALLTSYDRHATHYDVAMSVSR